MTFIPFVSCKSENRMTNLVLLLMVKVTKLQIISFTGKSDKKIIGNVTSGIFVVGESRDQIDGEHNEHQTFHIK